MHTTVNQTMFRDAFDKADLGEAFSPSAFNRLADYYAKYHPDMEWLPATLCANWEEYDSMAELADDMDATDGTLSERTIIIQCEAGHFLVATD